MFIQPSALWDLCGYTVLFLTLYWDNSPFHVPCSLVAFSAPSPLSPAAMRWALLHFAFSPPPVHTESPARHSAGTEAMSPEL